LDPPASLEQMAQESGRIRHEQGISLRPTLGNYTSTVFVTLGDMQRAFQLCFFIDDPLPFVVSPTQEQQDEINERLLSIQRQKLVHPNDRRVYLHFLIY
jgi:hypothetical protein